MPLLNITSRQKTIGTNSNFKIQIKSDLRIKRRFKVASVIIPNTHYPVNTNNNKLQWQDSASNGITTTIPIGNYTPSSLAIALGVVMTADGLAGDTIVVTENTLESKFNFSTSGGFLEFQPNTITTAGELLGIDTTKTLTITTNADVHNIFNVSGCNEFYVRSDIQPRDFAWDENGTTDVLVKMPVSSNFGSTLFYIPDYDWYYLSNERIINTISWRITDCDGNDIDLNGQHWSITLWIE